MNDQQEELFDLLIAQATIGLGAEEDERLAVLLLALPEAEAEALRTEVEAVLAAAATASALDRAGAAGKRADDVPDALATRLEADADRFFGKTPGLAPVTDLGAARRQKAVTTAPVTRSPRRKLGAYAGWAVAALLLLVVLVRGPESEVPGFSAPDRAALAALEDTLTVPWAVPEDPDFAGVTGDVTWNDRLQTGYLRLSGMPVNDPGRAQYQLWIVDPSRDAEPVDGGVFDIPAGAGEVIIPIRATLPVRQPAAFAITREKPGGVVVSEGPLRVVASAG